MSPDHQQSETVTSRWRGLLTALFIKPFGKTLKGFLFSRILVVALLTFASVLLTATLLYENLLARQASTTSRGIAEQTFTAINTLMVYGPSREELDGFIAELKNSHSTSPYRIEVHRSELTYALYYQAAERREPSPEVAAVLNSGQSLIRENKLDNSYLFPLLAENRCLGCHRNAEAGAVLGVVKVVQNLEELTSRMRSDNIGLFIIYGLAILAMVLSLSLFVTGRVSGVIELFRRKTTSVETLTDLNGMMNSADSDLYFAELNQAFAAVGELAGRLQNIAVDRDLLEFEIKILSKFIITSHAIRDWRGFVKELLVDINSIVDAYVVFAIFKESDDQYKLDVFWRGTPYSGNRELLEKLIRRQAADCLPLDQDQPGIKINHHIAQSAVPIPRGLTSRDLELHARSLRLDSPGVHGAVGIGVQARAAEDPLSRLVLDSVLAALLNLVGSVKAISEFTRTLEYYATRDPLTHLHNQRMFWELLEYETNRAERHNYLFAVLTIDMDNFKAVNDSHGHAFGDTFLNHFAALLRKAVRDGDFVCRYGGDEFTVILPETSAEQAYAVSSRIAEELAAADFPAPDGSRITATISIGIALFPKHAKTPRDLFMVADSMMYKVKGEGKNAIAIAEPEELARIFRYADGINSLIFQALEKKSILPFFQPIFDTLSGEIEAHELLMRMRLEDGRLLPAEDFSQAAENMGLTYQLDRLLIEKGLAAAAEQHDHDGLLFINISPAILIAPEFPALITELTNNHRIAAERIVFQVSERITVANRAMLRKFCGAMQEKGFRFCITEFGSGNSSFKCLKELPVAFIKIEKEFITGLLGDSDNVAFVKSIILLAREMGLKTLAGEINDETLHNLIGRLGIDYYLGSPERILAVPEEG